MGLLTLLVHVKIGCKLLKVAKSPAYYGTESIAGL